MNKLFSIIVPAYNASSTIAQCIESVLEQDSNDWELIIIDDGSNDNTYDICSSYSKIDKRVLCFKQDNKGVSVARNIGIALSKGDYLTFLDADDWLEPDFIEAFMKSKMADINICGYREVYPDGKVKCEWMPNTLYSENPLDTYTVRNSYFRTPWAIVFKKSFLATNNLHFFENLSWGEDTMYLLCATIKAKNINFVSSVLYDYRYTGVGLTNSLKRHNNMVQFLDIYSDTVKDVANRSPHASSMMNELILFLAIILLNEIVQSDRPMPEKKDIISHIHQYLRQLPFIFICRTKVGRIRYAAAILSRIFSVNIAYQIYRIIA